MKKRLSVTNLVGFLALNVVSGAVSIRCFEIRYLVLFAGELSSKKISYLYFCESQGRSDYVLIWASAPPNIFFRPIQNYFLPKWEIIQTPS